MAHSGLLVTAAIALCGAVISASAFAKATADKQVPSTSTPQAPTSSIAGRILQPDGAATENARVSVYAVRKGASDRSVAGRTTSSYDGRYEITGLPTGTYVIGVTPAIATAPTPRGVARASPVETFYPDTPDVEQARRIDIVAGVPLEGIDVWLSPAPQRYSVSGRVFMPDGIAPRQLVIEYGGADVIRRGLWYVYDPGGLFEIEGVAQGPLVMLARAETDKGTYMGIAATMVTVESVQDVRIAMRSPGRIEGRVVFEREPPAGTGPLKILPVQTLLKLSALYPVQEATVGHDGGFQIQEALGAYTLDVHALPPGWRVKRVLRSAQPVPDGRITVGPTEVVRDVQVLVGPGST